MIGELIFHASGKTHPSYILDCDGNLIRRSAEGDALSLLPYAIELVSKSSELQNPLPWTLTLERLLSRLRSVAEASPAINLAYPGLDIPRLPLPFVAPARVDEDDAVINQAIALYPSLAAGDASALEEQLATVGVVRIAVAGSFNEQLHEASGSGITIPPLEEVSAGWLSNKKIYRKAVVRSA